MPDAAPGVVLDEERLQDALGRFAVVRSHLQDGVALSAAAAQAGVSARTARRWLASYRSGGLAELARPSRSDRGRRRTPAVLVELIEGLALTSGAADRVHPPSRRRGRARARVAGAELRDRARGRARAGPRAGGARPRRAGALPRALRARVSPRGQRAQRDLAGRPHPASDDGHGGCLSLPRRQRCRATPLPGRISPSARRRASSSSCPPRRWRGARASGGSRAAARRRCSSPPPSARGPCPASALRGRS
jgi:hypothetical protein